MALQQRCASQTGASIQPGPQPMPAHMTVDTDHAAKHSPSLQYNGLLRDGKLSWVTNSGTFTHRVVTCQARVQGQEKHQKHMYRVPQNNQRSVVFVV